VLVPILGNKVKGNRFGRRETLDASKNNNYLGSFRAHNGNNTLANNANENTFLRKRQSLNPNFNGKISRNKFSMLKSCNNEDSDRKASLIQSNKCS
jgi:hypothetical protein